MSALSSSTLRLAYRSKSGEYAWHPRDALQAVSELEAADKVVLGGEVWLVQEGHIYGMVPMPEGPPAVVHWEVSPRAPAEPWRAYTSRAAAHARAAIADLLCNGVSPCVATESVYINLTWESEDEYSADSPLV